MHVTNTLAAVTCFGPVTYSHGLVCAVKSHKSAVSAKKRRDDEPSDVVAISRSCEAHL